MAEFAQLNAALRSKGLETAIGPFAISEVLGQGGAGVVYGAVRGNRPFAVKILLNATSQKRRRFVDEYVGGMELPSHPGIARPLHFGDANLDGNFYPYIVMKRYEGTLKAATSNVIPGKALSTAAQLLDALEHLHSNGVVHRDLKPANIFRAGDQLLIGDLGIASFDAERFSKIAKTREGERLANVEFSAPEQMTNAPASPTMDIYAFGQVMQWFCTGRTHRGTGRARIPHAGGVLATLDEAIERCIANDPGKRPQSSAEVRALLTPARDSPIDFGTRKWDQLHSFDGVLRKSNPKVRGSYELNDSISLNRLFENLSGVVEQSKLWWTDSDEGDYRISEMRLAPDGSCWLIDEIEFPPDRAMVFRDDSVFANFVVVLTSGSRPFFDTVVSRERDFAAWWKGRYISANEHSNGYAELDGQICELKDPGAESRVRFLTRRALLLAPYASSAMQKGNEVLLQRLLRSIESGNISVNELVDYGRSMKTHIDADVDLLR